MIERNGLSTGRVSDWTPLEVLAQFTVNDSLLLPKHSSNQICTGSQICTELSYFLSHTWLDQGRILNRNKAIQFLEFGVGNGQLVSERGRIYKLSLRICRWPDYSVWTENMEEVCTQRWVNQKAERKVFQVPVLVSSWSQIIFLPSDSAHFIFS